MPLAFQNSLIGWCLAHFEQHRSTSSGDEVLSVGVLSVGVLSVEVLSGGMLGGEVLDGEVSSGYGGEVLAMSCEWRSVGGPPIAALSTLAMTLQTPSCQKAELF